MKKILLSLVLISTISASAESLFSLSATQSSIIEPKALYSSVRARNVGDLVSIVLEETATSSDSGSYSTSKNSNLAQNVTKFFKVLKKNTLTEALDAANDGGLTVANTTAVSRTMSFTDTITAQVVQVLPNGNLLVQGKKSLVQQNERLDLIVSGVVDPKWINQSGEVSSNHVANLQFAMSGAGTVSRGQNEGIINRAIRTVF